jgi:hypothetical protein
MTSIDNMDKNNWRNDTILKSAITYTKRFAYVPVKLDNGAWVWWKPVYRKYIHWFAEFSGYKISEIYGHESGMHTDRCDLIDEPEYLYRKLAEK